MKNWLSLSLFCLGLMLLVTPGCGRSECQQDSQCGEGESCQSGQCEKKGSQITSCTQNSDCKSGETCKGGQCASASVSCQGDSDCKVGERCESSRCVKAECTVDGDCAGKTKPYCSTARLCEWDCKEDSHCPAGNTCKANACVTPSASTCKEDKDCEGQARPYCSDKGECSWQCKQDNDCKISQECGSQSHLCEKREGFACEQDADCKASELCGGTGGGYSCVQTCDPNTSVKPVQSNCPSGQVCLGIGQPGKDQKYAQGGCMLRCQPGQKSCPAGSQCLDVNSVGAYGGDLICASGRPRLEICLTLGPLPTAGTRQIGEVCDAKSEIKTKRCDGHKGLVCTNVYSLTGEEGKCALGCRIDATKPCPDGQECVALLDRVYGSGGVCRPQGTQKAGESCDEATKRCLPGLYCSEGGLRVCVKEADLQGSVCGPQKPCVSGMLCLARRCTKPCDPAQGTDTNPVCGAGQRCNPCVLPESEGICAIERKEGETCDDGVYVCVAGLVCNKSTNKCESDNFRKEGQPCSTNTRCLPGLVCSLLEKVCRAYCDPTQGMMNNPACSSSQQCIGAPGVLGLCVTIGTASLSCQSQSCISGHFCYQGRCRKVCSFADGFPDNPGCLGSLCRVRGFLTAWCEARAAVEQGPKEEGETCDGQTQGSSSCNGNKKLFCLMASGAVTGACKKSCRVGGSGECGAGETCVMVPTDSIGLEPNPTGGMCLKDVPRKEGESCDDAKLQLCAPGLLCNNNLCWKLCDISKGRTNNPACAASQYCGSTQTLNFFLSVCQTPSQKEGESCSLTKHCEASLYCYRGTCTRPCDRKKGATNNADCGASQRCETFTAWPTLGTQAPPQAAVCVPNSATQTSGQACDGFHKRCQDPLFCGRDGRCKAAPLAGEYERCGEKPCGQGLFCLELITEGDLRPSPGWCAKPCDPKQGEENNPACSASQRCYPASLLPYDGFCAPK